jgi:hypothetical protein
VTSVRYHEAAQDELFQEIAYLELHAGGLGQRFFLEVRRSQDLIARFPASAVEILPGIRSAYSGNFATRSCTQSTRMLCSYLRWLTTVGGLATGPAAYARADSEG